MVTRYFVSVEDSDEDNRVEYFNSLTGVVEFADLMEHQGYSVAVKIEFQSLQF